MTVLRHLLSILLLPFVVVVLVPFWLLEIRGLSGPSWPPDTDLEWLALAAGIVLLIAGLALFGWCVALFARVGRGTLAPWDPTGHLVVVGPYRCVRNPMITAVAAMLFAEAFILESVLQAAWAVAFVAINHVYFVLSEEPGLERRFGLPYLLYREEVPRWIPRAAACILPLNRRDGGSERSPSSSRPRW